MIDHYGITREHGVPVTVPWKGIRHVAVTRGKHGHRDGRWLLVDAGTVPDSWWPARTIWPGRAAVRLWSRRRGFLVNVPMALLGVEPANIIGATRYYSPVAGSRTAWALPCSKGLVHAGAGWWS